MRDQEILVVCIPWLAQMLELETVYNYTHVLQNLVYVPVAPSFNI